MKYEYVAIFEDDDDWIKVHFVDHDDWFTCGKNISEAIEYAADLLQIRLYELEEKGEPAPPASPSKVKLKGNQLCRIIEADTDSYRQLLKEIDGNPIRYARQQTGMSIKEMSDYLEVPYRTAQEWNSGRIRPPRWCEKLIVDKLWSK